MHKDSLRIGAALLLPPQRLLLFCGPFIQAITLINMSKLSSICESVSTLLSISQLLTLTEKTEAEGCPDSFTFLS